MTLDPTKLREAAERATPGPWHHCNPFQVVPKQKTIHGPVPAQRVDYVSTYPGAGTPKGHRGIIPMEGRESAVRSEDMAFIALANPAVILALVERVETAEAENERLRARNTEHESRFEAESARADAYKARAEKLAEALRPVAKAADNYADCRDDGKYIDDDATVCVGDLREARAALSPATTDEVG